MAAVSLDLTPDKWLPNLRSVCVSLWEQAEAAAWLIVCYSSPCVCYLNRTSLSLDFRFRPVGMALTT